MAKTKTRLIKIAKKAFQYTETKSALGLWGFPRDIYYDTVSEEFIIQDFPVEGHQFELSVEPEFGIAEIEVGGKQYKVRIYEP